ncbi:hypothetical protein FRX31_024090 [Thalictrum thalictroides]|uniref:Uncharacterized protein n=1 Tax=Thalictrum thalictroides TaxID=46969 RepID=A0A7J6VN42_THATH|nr:hypothetical protein FRX31_024090 [Thalictrum thalictroides]
MAGGAIATARRTMNSGSRQRLSRRPMPKRGQVKAGIAIGLAHSLSAIFSLNNTRSRSSTTTTASLVANPRRNV